MSSTDWFSLTILRWLAITLLIPASSYGAKILCIFPHAGESHFAVMRSVVFELAKRQHNVTIYSSHRLTEHDENIRERIIEPEYPFWLNLQKIAGVKNNLIELSQLDPAALQKSLSAAGAANMDYFLSNHAVQELFKLSTQEFDYDLIMVDLFYTDALLALGHIHNKPTMAIVNTDFENYMQHIMESVVPAACSPIEFDSYQKDIKFWQRTQLIRQCINRRKLFEKSHLAQEQLLTKHLAHITASQVPTIAELHGQLAVLLLNNYVPLITPRPMLQNTILAGGLHIRAPRELPWHVRRYLDEARFGVIYMNLGNEQLCAELPTEKLQLLFEAFGDSKLLWTCHDEHKLTNVPNTWMVQHMVPQTDILAHPHIKIFIMSGELLSLQEAIVRHVPILGLPIFRNEVRNMQLATKLEVGIQLNQSNVTVAALQWAHKQLTYESNYATAIRKVSKAFRDRPLGGLETAMYWIEYVLRHNDDVEIKTRGIGIASNQLHLFDLFLFYFVVALLITVGLIGMVFLGFIIWKRRENQKMYSKLS